MKRIVIISLVILGFANVLSADDRPVTYDKLPEAAKTFLSTYFNGGKDALLIAKDDDLVSPDYYVVLNSGVRLQFENNGSLEKIETRNGVLEGIIPVQIIEVVKAHYPQAVILEYEVGKRSYEVKLSNGLELSFNRNFQLVEIDD